MFKKTESLDNATLARAPISLAIMTYELSYIPCSPNMQVT